MTGLIETGFVLLALIGAGPPAAQPAPGVLLAQERAPKATRPEKKILINFDSTPLNKAVQWMSKRTGHNFIVEDALNQRRITIVSTTAVSPEEANRAFLSALDTEGLFTSEQGQFIRITSRPVHGSVRAEAGVSTGEGPPLEGIRQIDDTTWTIDRTTYLAWLASTPKMAMQARIVPFMEDGINKGFKLFAIRRSSLYARLGIQNGDVILKINGSEITDPEKALEVYAKLKGAKTIEVDLLRRGQARKHTYRLE